MIPTKQIRKLKFGDVTCLTWMQLGFQPILRSVVLDLSTKN